MLGIKYYVTRVKRQFLVYIALFFTGDEITLVRWLFDPTQTYYTRELYVQLYCELNFNQIPLPGIPACPLSLASFSINPNHDSYIQLRLD